MLTRLLALLAVLLLAPASAVHANARVLSLESAHLGFFTPNRDFLKKIPGLSHCCIKEKSTEQADSSNRREEYLRARYMDPSQGRFLGMDSFAGSVYSPITLNKYLYGHQAPTINTDPSGNEATVIGQLSILESRAVLVKVSAQSIRLLKMITTALDIADVIAQPANSSLVDPRLGLRVFPLALAAARTCYSSGTFVERDCKFDRPTFIIGGTTPRHREIVTKAIALGSPILLTRREPPLGRSWLKCPGSVVGDALDCDEYPYASTHQGGPNGMSYFELNTPMDNRAAGGYLVTTLYGRCGVAGSRASGDPFSVLPLRLPGVPTVGICGNR